MCSNGSKELKPISLKVGEQAVYVKETMPWPATQCGYGALHQCSLVNEGLLGHLVVIAPLTMGDWQ